MHARNMFVLCMLATLFLNYGSQPPRHIAMYYRLYICSVTPAYAWFGLETRIFRAFLLLNMNHGYEYGSIVSDDSMQASIDMKWNHKAIWRYNSQLARHALCLSQPG